MQTSNIVHSLSFGVWTWLKICLSRVLLILHLQMSPTAIQLYCPPSLYFVFKMHSKSDNLGYLKDQNNVKFSGGFTPWTPTLDPLGRAQGTHPLPPKPSSSKVLASLAVTYLSFFWTHASRVVACLYSSDVSKELWPWTFFHTSWTLQLSVWRSLVFQIVWSFHWWSLYLIMLQQGQQPYLRNHTSCDCHWQYTSVK